MALLSSNSLASCSPMAASSLPFITKGQFAQSSCDSSRQIIDLRKRRRNLGLVANSVAGDDGASVNFDVPFPTDYSELLSQAREATELALRDKKELMEIEFPTAGLESVPGDGEGGIEMTESMQLIREFCDRLISPENARRTRIVYFGFVTKVKMSDRVKPEDELFVVGYPYFNVNEMLVEELYKEAVVGTNRSLIIFNGELDRIRSGYYPSFFYPKLAALTKTLLPKMDSLLHSQFQGKERRHPFQVLSWAVESSEEVEQQQVRMRAPTGIHAVAQGSRAGHPSICLTA